MESIEAIHPILKDALISVNSTMTLFIDFYNSTPFSSALLRYIRNSYQHDPMRVLVELALVLFMLKYIMTKAYKIGSREIALTEMEIDELIDEWHPEPLVPKPSDFDKLKLDKMITVSGSAGSKLKLKDGKLLLDFASFNFLGFAANENIRRKVAESLSKYGVGACGPPGFYGTIDVHMDLEKKIASFLGTKDAILYSQSFATVPSAIAAFAKRGDLIICDEGVNFAIQKALQISRSKYQFFKHNNMEDLEQVLEKIQRNDKKSNEVSRRFIIAEGLYANDGSIAPLDELIRIKNKYRYRLFLDESLSFGTLGKNGRGLSEYFNVNVEDIDLIIGSLSNAVAGNGGFTTGSIEIVDHQRLSGSSYVFSAAMPAVLAIANLEALSLMDSQEGENLQNTLKENVSAFRSGFSNLSIFKNSSVRIHVTGNLASPLIHVQLIGKDVESMNYEQQYRLLQEVVDEASKDGILLSMARYVESQEMFPVKPSIRITINSLHSKKDCEKAALQIKESFKNVFRRKKYM